MSQCLGKIGLKNSCLATNSLAMNSLTINFPIISGCDDHD